MPIPADKVQTRQQLQICTVNISTVKIPDTSFAHESDLLSSTKCMSITLRCTDLRYTQW